MRTPTSLWLLLNLLATLVAVPAFAQVTAVTDAMRIDPAVQRERDTTRLSILQDELAKETRELSRAQNDCRDAQAYTATSATVQECAARVSLHRMNVDALEREIALTKNPRSVAPLRQSRKTSVAQSPQQQPDDWVIRPQQLPLLLPAAVPLLATASRRRLLSVEPVLNQPPWIISSSLRSAVP